MSVKNRLIALSLVFILSLLTISTVSYFNTKSSSNDLTNISDERMPLLLTIAELDTLRYKLRAITFEVFSVHKNSDYSKNLQAIKESRETAWNDINKNWQYFASTPRQTEAGKKALNYVKARGLSDETIKIWGLGYAPGGWDTLLKHFAKTEFQVSELEDAGLLTLRDDGSSYDRFRDRLMFPIRNNLGKMTGFGARALNPDDVPKYLNSPKTELFDKGHLLYGMDLARREMRQLNQAVIVEGYMDVIALHQAGYKNVVASMGTALTEEQFGLLKRTTRNIVLALDADQAGQNATLRGLETARRTMGEELDMTFDSRGLLRFERHLKADIRVTTLPEGLDPDEIVNEDPEQWRAIVANAKPIVVHVMQTLAQNQDLDDAKVKREIAAQVMPLIEDIADAVEREGYRQQLANFLRIDERALRTSPDPGGSQTRRRRHAEPETEQTLPSPALANLSKRNRLLETHILSFLIRAPETVYKLNRQLGILNLSLLSQDDFQESDCKLAFGIVQASLEQDAEPAIDYLEQHLPDIFDPIEPQSPDLVILEPSKEKQLLDQLKSVLRLRKNIIEDRQQEMQFIQSDPEMQELSKEEASSLYIELLNKRRTIDHALASPFLPEDKINKAKN